MEMYQVRYFLALADTLNFTRAAEQCAVTQPALTRAIKLLEEELGGLLFHRERANSQLTELGQMVRPHLEHVYGKTQETKRLAKDFAQGKNTKLKLGIMCTIAPEPDRRAYRRRPRLAIPQSSCSFAMQMPGISRSSCSRVRWKSRSIVCRGASPRRTRM